MVALRAQSPDTRGVCVLEVPLGRAGRQHTAAMGVCEPRLSPVCHSSYSAVEQYKLRMSTVHFKYVFVHALEKSCLFKVMLSSVFVFLLLL